MKFVIFTKFFDSIWLEEVCEPCEKFNNYHFGCNHNQMNQWWQST
jgi:hypothetical protein